MVHFPSVDGSAVLADDQALVVGLPFPGWWSALVPFAYQRVIPLHPKRAGYLASGLLDVWPGEVEVQAKVFQQEAGQVVLACLPVRQRPIPGWSIGFVRDDAREQCRVGSWCRHGCNQSLGNGGRVNPSEPFDACPHLLTPPLARPQLGATVPRQNRQTRARPPENTKTPTIGRGANSRGERDLACYRRKLTLQAHMHPTC